MVGSTGLSESLRADVTDMNSREINVGGTLRSDPRSRRQSGRFDSRKAMARQAAATVLDFLPQRKLVADLVWLKRAIARGDRPVAPNDTARDLINSAMAYCKEREISSVISNTRMM